MVHLTNLHLKNFTCFSDLEISFSPGVNVFIGANGTGKTHILKVLYAACIATREESRDTSFPVKLPKLFSPLISLSDDYTVFHRNPEEEACVKITNSQNINSCTFPSIGDQVSKSIPVSCTIKEISDCKQKPIPSLYIPVKEILSHASGFLSLVKTRYLPFDDTYSDLLTQVFMPPLKEPPFKELRNKLLDALKVDDVIVEGERFYLKSGVREFEFSVVAEGWRKIALLLLLIRNGSIAPGSVLFWDEPEANLNPALLNLVIKALLIFQQAGIQVFLTTHNYVLLKEFDLQTSEEDQVRYFSLYSDDKKNGVKVSFSDTYLGIENNEIAHTYDDLFNRDIERKLKGFTK